ncbi:MAG: hypothetical protein R3F61_25830 [Myxococcota bacterium]
MIALALLSSAANARGFDDASLPYATTFSFDWSTGANGSTAFTFLNGTQTTGNSYPTICDDTDGCLSGDFSTGNSGTGTYQTEVVLRNPVSCLVNVFLGCSGIRNVTCALDQDLHLTYDSTAAEYDGSAQCGTVTFQVQYNGCGNPVELGRTYSYSANPYSGTLSHPSGATGTFSEL